MQRAITVTAIVVLLLVGVAIKVMVSPSKTVAGTHDSNRLNPERGIDLRSPRLASRHEGPAGAGGRRCPEGHGKPYRSPQFRRTGGRREKSRFW